MDIEIHGKLTAIGPDYEFSDATTSSQDVLAGKEMASVVGDLGLYGDAPADQWTQVMKALRVHGFKISFGG